MSALARKKVLKINAALRDVDDALGAIQWLPGIDWKLLRKQKGALFELSEALLDPANPSLLALAPYRDSIEGIISLIDELQDSSGRIFGNKIVYGRRR